MSSSLGLRFAPHLNPIVMANLEQAGRQCGLPLAQLELLGQDETKAVDFIAATIENRVLRFLADVDWDHLEMMYHDNQMPMPEPHPALRSF